MKLSMSGSLGFSGTLGETDCVTQYRPNIKTTHLFSGARGITGQAVLKVTGQRKFKRH